MAQGHESPVRRGNQTQREEGVKAKAAIQGSGKRNVIRMVTISGFLDIGRHSIIRHPESGWSKERCANWIDGRADPKVIPNV